MAPVEDFYMDRASKDGLYHSCKAHVADRNKRHYLKNYDRLMAKKRRDTAQVSGFNMKYRKLINAEVDIYTAFVEAICWSSDDKYDARPRGSTEKWADCMGMK